MENDKKPISKEDMDRFWDVGSLMPKQKKVFYVSGNTDAVDVVAEAPSAPEKQPPVVHYIPPHTPPNPDEAPKPQLSYEPDSPLISRVNIYHWKSAYHYYEDFVTHAVKLYPLKGKECPRVPFFSYVPQYSQMTREQLDWYLWWRDCFRHGTCIDTDYSYLVLFAYEIINLSGKIEPEKARDDLARLWANYRKMFRQLDGCLPEWICDYCLIHKLPPPELCLGQMLPDVIAHCNFREFFVISKTESGYVKALLTFCSNYDYHKSKFYAGSAASVFDSVIPSAVGAVLGKTSRDGRLFSSVRMDAAHLMRDAYQGALCSFRVKRRIEVEYKSFSHSHELRFLVTDIVKYTENKVRSAIGVRSKLTVYSLPDSVRKMLDEICSEKMPPTEYTKKKEEETPTYEALYDLPKKDFSLSDAAKIEAVSWETTEKLVSAFEGEESAEPPIAEKMPAEKPKDETNELAKFVPFLLALDSRNSKEIDACARALGLLPDAAADRVNELFCEAYGDILLEENVDGFAVIEDYRETFEGLVLESRKG